MSEDKLRETAQQTDINAFLREAGLTHTQADGDQKPTYNDVGQLGIVVKDDATDGAPEAAAAPAPQAEPQEVKVSPETIASPLFINLVMKHNSAVLAGMRHGTTRPRGAYAGIGSTKRLMRGVGARTERAATMDKGASVSAFYALSPIVRRRMVQKYLRDHRKTLPNAAIFARSQRQAPRAVELTPKGPSAPRTAHHRPHADLKNRFGIVPHPAPTPNRRMLYLSQQASKRLWYRSQFPSMTPR